MSGAVLTCRHPLFQGSAQRAHELIIVVVAAVVLVACSGNSDAPTARFEIMQYPEPGVHGGTFKGIGDFAAGEVSYTLYVNDGEPWLERQEFGPATSYFRYVDSDVWDDSDGTTPQSRAVVCFRNNLAASTDALTYLRTVAEDVTEVGTGTVRGAQTTHYRATVLLSRLGAPPEYDRFPVEVWMDDDGRIRRYRYHPVTLEPTEEIFVWEFFDFGVDVDLSPPAPDKVK